MDVHPQHQNIDKVFSNTTYYIDFYQRQYKWTEEPVKRLLEDIFYKFDDEYNKYKDSDIELEKLISKYGWYYLNTYVTNLVDGKLYVVDGQQRLTTLTLILIKLKHLTDKYKSELKDWIENKIAGTSGFKKEFWMNHEDHKVTLKALFEKDSELDSINVSSGLTAQNMLANYKIISSWLDNELKDKSKLESFVFYFMYRLVLINLNVEQTEVPMVFEVINDRGVRLKPYEILKGKLLGQIDKEEMDSLGLNELWEDQVNLINDFKEDEIDQFFTYFLKAKFSNTQAEGRKFDKDYHRVMFQDEVNNHLNLKHNPKKVKEFLQKDFQYYTNLYLKILKYNKQYYDEQPFVYFNNMTEMNTQFQVILSACKFNTQNDKVSSDPEEDDKINIISYEIDRMFCLLQLQRSYDSNDFANNIYKISTEIREKDKTIIRGIFDKYLLDRLSDARGVKATSHISYSFFKDTGIELEKRFKRYFFARIEKFIANNTNLKMKHDLYDLVQNTGARNGFHIEHILAENNENLSAFNSDKELFEKERNRLGALLLLKGRDNQSSNNETYKHKLKSYANTLYWNETLREDTYKSKIDFKEMINKYKLNFRSMPTFGSSELEERHKLLFDIINIIWN